MIKKYLISFAYLIIKENDEVNFGYYPNWTADTQNALAQVLGGGDFR
ncbi:hypothetical protein ACIQ1D_03295 [Lysinibacillus xylanilyticus]